MLNERNKIKAILQAKEKDGVGKQENTITNKPNCDTYKIKHC